MQLLDQFDCATSEMQRVVHGVEHRHGKALQQRHARTERLTELHLAAHRALGHFGDLLAASGGLSQLVDDLLVDQRGVHIHHQQTGPAQRGCVKVLQ